MQRSGVYKAGVLVRNAKIASRRPLAFNPGRQLPSSGPAHGTLEQPLDYKVRAPPQHLEDKGYPEKDETLIDGSAATNLVAEVIGLPKTF